MSNPTPSAILIITDDTALSTELSVSLRAWAHYEVEHLSIDEAIGETIEELNPDIILLDMANIEVDQEGQSFARKLKKQIKAPLIALVAEAGLKRFDFTLGPDDFILKPVNPTELTARIKHIHWKKSAIDSDSLIKCGDMLIDMIKYEVSIDGRIIDLSFKEYELLKVLVINRGRVLTRQTLLDKVWGYDYYGGDRTVDVHIRRLRSKIEDAEHEFVQTVRNVGYKFKDQT